MNRLSFSVRGVRDAVDTRLRVQCYGGDAPYTVLWDAHATYDAPRVVATPGKHPLCQATENIHHIPGQCGESVVDGAQVGGTVPISLSSYPNATAPIDWIPDLPSDYWENRDGKTCSKPQDYNTPLPAIQRVADFWPSYEGLTPPARRAYLQWLAGGRHDPTADIAYIFLFFYGLEYRCLRDKPTAADLNAIIAEVRRLMYTYGHNASFQRYALKFVAVLTAKVVSVPNPKPPSLRDILMTWPRLLPRDIKEKLAAHALAATPVSGLGSALDSVVADGKYWTSTRSSWSFWSRPVKAVFLHTLGERARWFIPWCVRRCGKSLKRQDVSRFSMSWLNSC